MFQRYALRGDCQEQQQQCDRDNCGLRVRTSCDFPGGRMAPFFEQTLRHVSARKRFPGEHAFALRHLQEAVLTYADVILPQQGSRLTSDINGIHTVYWPACGAAIDAP